MSWCRPSPCERRSCDGRRANSLARMRFRQRVAVARATPQGRSLCRETKYTFRRAAPRFMPLPD
eukprot:9050469-Alexandrium_andersonii.AAC.1